LKIKLDENLPERLVSELSRLGHDVDTVRAEHLAGQSDRQVWQATQSGNRFLITPDLDFSDMRLYTPGTYGGLLLVRLAHPGKDALMERDAALFATEPVDQWRVTYGFSRRPGTESNHRRHFFKGSAG